MDYFAYLFCSCDGFSTSSFLYPFNGWVDVNTIFTVGKSIFHGFVPYRDLIDQKGFILYLIFGLASLVSYTSLTGLYLIEIISCYFFLFLSYKIMLLFDNRQCLFLLPVMGLIIYGSYCFCLGGSAEELCLPMLSLQLYICLKALVQNRSLTKSEAFVLGISFSYIFWIKYTMVGLFIGLAFYYVWFSVKRRYFNSLWKVVLFFIIGLIPIISIVLIYFVANHALDDMFNVYIYQNIFQYHSPGKSLGFFNALISNGVSIKSYVIMNPLYSLLLLLSLYFIIRRCKPNVRSLLIISLICLHFFIFIGIYQTYYPLALAVFLPFGLLEIGRMVGKYSFQWGLVLKKEVYITFLSLFSVLIFFTSWNTGNILKSKSECVQYDIKDKIHSYQQGTFTLLEYNMMDAGFYTVCGVIPTIRYFAMLNLNPNKILAEQTSLLLSGGGRPAFVISKDKIHFNGYVLMSQSSDYQKDLRDRIETLFPFIHLNNKPTQYYLYKLNQR